ncbi:hypothetical protein AK812_SmicGene40765 [Symbiodinium microadriaticum]|uniref:Uncharacterized protein n=1 Tax=Symbiodinium microadriaticum TaxID=2951 RepID=A0A1Q9C7U1_SYMMI|nr:hypothetical protein AK812_SmicGene40765 [Symbiodinium microadriaticum]CAE7632301.1 unnamed protein product [Symbiodinium microadriaticum]CAE7924288.1 unnamed protein product [Symbiodinium sp. KB8]
MWRGWLPVCGPQCFFGLFSDDQSQSPRSAKQRSYEGVKEDKGSNGQRTLQREVRVPTWEFDSCRFSIPLLGCLVLFALVILIFSQLHADASAQHPPIVIPDCRRNFTSDAPHINVRAMAYCCHHLGLHCQDLELHAGANGGMGPRDPVHAVRIARDRSRPKNAVQLVRRPLWSTQEPRFDCKTGLSTWQRGWSDNKKDWCCLHEGRGCTSFDCTGSVHSMPSGQREWCCQHFQKGCPPEAPRSKCNEHCHGTASTCRQHFRWILHNLFPNQENACTLAYSKVQLECDACWQCSVEEMGCEDGSDRSFDCSDDPYGWKQQKQEFCCQEHGLGCRSDHLPDQDAGLGKTWARAKVDNSWTWVKRAADYDCFAALQNAAAAWSSDKKAYCCWSHGLGC